MSDQPEFGHKLAAHLEYRNHLPRRFKAGKAADRLFLARVTADHHAEVAEVAETHLAAAHADGKIIKGLRAEVERLRAALTKVQGDRGTLNEKITSLEQDRARMIAEAEAADRNLDLAADRLNETEVAVSELEANLTDALQVAAIRLSEAEAAGTEAATLKAELAQAKHDLADLEGRIATQVLVDGEPVGRDAAPVPLAAAPATPAKARTRKPAAGAK